ncbi:restriction endonuclease [Mycobacteroides abscessus]|uniref:HNH endonuclease n=1 Tax=Mycobacteroides abscessus TaxID=36809 RepID=UPI0005E46615|nr:HNH endonuclease [Mycobacteroides abscessus]CPX20647.1 restriction endonuclease [Mycobacteroides abscessus]CRG61235.1 restriction endonuclease [Mycobacteroides abscessus]
MSPVHGKPYSATPARRAARKRWRLKQRAARSVIQSLPCVYCGGEGGTADHVRPVSRGGRNGISNLVPACETCNTYKGHLTLAELATFRPDLVLHALYVNARVRIEFVRLRMPLDQRGRFERALGLPKGTPLIEVPEQRLRPSPRRPQAQPSQPDLVAAQRGFASMSPDDWFSPTGEFDGAAA